MPSAPRFRRSRPLVAALVLALAAIGLLGPDRAARADRVGLNAQQLTNDLYSDPLRSLRLVATAASLNAGEVRLPVGWGWIESTPPVDGRHRYDWWRYDQLLLELARKGIRVQADIDGTPAFEVPARCLRGSQGAGMPEHPAWYGAFVRAFVDRYGPGGTLWRDYPDVPARPVRRIELGNEQNHPYRWCTGAPNGGEYARLVRSALDALGRDRPVAVITGGLYPLYAARGDATVPDDRFLVQMRDADPTILDDVDAIGLHDYGDQAGASAGDHAFPDATMVELALTRWKLMMAGIPPWKPVAITETGIPGVPVLRDDGSVAVDADVGDDQRGQALVAATRRLLAADCGVSQVQVHTLAGSMEVPPLDGYEGGIANPAFRLRMAEAFFGLARLDGSLRPAGEVWRAFAATAPPAAGSTDECSSILRGFAVDDDLRAVHPEYYDAGGRLRTSAP
ncbi:hypothetical protein [Patulibacter defluvii]|uniref:hypothetical protein n=1 Tax=Patulibacter defluvii TaxID=3095358 RepID=UPI002A766119|nr:hypothetical protein [Patulibacter sp. DM4]